MITDSLTSQLLYPMEIVLNTLRMGGVGVGLEVLVKIVLPLTGLEPHVCVIAWYVSKFCHRCRRVIVSLSCCDEITLNPYMCIENSFLLTLNTESISLYPFPNLARKRKVTLNKLSDLQWCAIRVPIT